MKKVVKNSAQIFPSPPLGSPRPVKAGVFLVFSPNPLKKEKIRGIILLTDPHFKERSLAHEKEADRLHPCPRGCG